MTDIIKEIEKAIEIAAFQRCEFQDKTRSECERDKQYFLGGAKLVLPMLQQAIRQRDILIDLENVNHKTFKENRNKELLSLIEVKE